MSSSLLLELEVQAANSLSLVLGFTGSAYLPVVFLVPEYVQINRHN